MHDSGMARGGENDGCGAEGTMTDDGRRMVGGDLARLGFLRRLVRGAALVLRLRRDPLASASQPLRRNDFRAVKRARIRYRTLAERRQVLQGDRGA